MKPTTAITIMFIGAGASFYIIGYLFRIMHWPGALMSIYVGQALALVGVVIFLVGKIRRS